MAGNLERMLVRSNEPEINSSSLAHLMRALNSVVVILLIVSNSLLELLGLRKFAIPKGLNSFHSVPSERITSLPMSFSKFMPAFFRKVSLSKGAVLNRVAKVLPTPIA